MEHLCTPNPPLLATLERCMARRHDTGLKATQKVDAVPVLCQRDGTNSELKGMSQRDMAALIDGAPGMGAPDQLDSEHRYRDLTRALKKTNPSRRLDAPTADDRVVSGHEQFDETGREADECADAEGSEHAPISAQE